MYFLSVTLILLKLEQMYIVFANTVKQPYVVMVDHRFLGEKVLQIPPIFRFLKYPCQA